MRNAKVDPLLVVALMRRLARAEGKPLDHITVQFNVHELHDIHRDTELSVWMTPSNGSWTISATDPSAPIMVDVVPVQLKNVTPSA